MQIQFRRGDQKKLVGDRVLVIFGVAPPKSSSTLVVPGVVVNIVEDLASLTEIRGGSEGGEEGESRGLNSAR
jgi:hypothetical protein